MYTSWSYRLQTSMMLLIISSFISQINAQNMSSYFECKTSNECNYDMHCIDGQDCSVTCISEGSCAHGVIYPPNSGNLTVTCGPNAYTCLGMTLRGPRNGSFALSCNGHETCRWVSVICPIFGDCTVDIVSVANGGVVVAPTYTARNIDMIIDGRNMTSGKLHVVDLQESTVHCPRNYLECVADCITAPCTGTSFHTKDDSILRIFASGASSLQNVNVYCALNANCSITVTQPGSDALSHFKLYSIDAMDGFIDKRFICDYEHDVSECYDYKDPPQLWCGLQYDTGCAMVNTGNNSWQCQNMTVSELCTNNETLSGYYGSQIVCKDKHYDIMYCIDGQDCSVTCISEGSCAHGAIHPPNSGNLTVTCGPNAYTCLGMALRGPTNGSFALSCRGDGACRWVSVICPIFGDCTV
eukprot:416333_1